MFRRWQSAATQFLLKMIEVAVFHLVSHIANHPSFPIWQSKFSHLTRWSPDQLEQNLRSFKSLWQGSMRLGQISGVSSGLSPMTRHVIVNRPLITPAVPKMERKSEQGFSSSFVTPGHSFAVPSPSLVACWRIAVKGLLWMASHKLSRSPTPFWQLPKSLSTPLSSSMPFSTTWTVVQDVPRPFAMSQRWVPHKKVQKFALDYLPGKTFKSTKK